MAVLNEIEIDGISYTLFDINKIYPIGSIYMNVNSTNPSNIFGGTWEQIKDKFLLCAGDSYTSGSTGGESSHTLTVDEMPSHRHWISAADFDDGNGTSTGLSNSQYYGLWSDAGSYDSNDRGKSLGRYDAYSGGSQPHNNMPPYLAVNVWQRTA